MSLIYLRKSTGINTDPCGTHNVMFDIDELQFLTEKCCFLLLKKDLYQHCMTPQMLLRNLAIQKWCLLSNDEYT